MSLQTLVGVSTPNWSLAETLTRIHAALSDCKSVRGLYSVQRHFGASYIKLKSEEILSVPEDSYINDSDFARKIKELDESTQGLEACWEVERFRCNGSHVELWSSYVSFLFQPPTHRSEILAGVKDECFIDAGLQRYYLPTRMLDDVAAEAAALNLELLVEELGGIAEIPVKRLSGIPIHNIDLENPISLNSLWLFFDGTTHHRDIGNLRIQPTNAGPLYYSPIGPLGDLASLPLEGNL